MGIEYIVSEKLFRQFPEEEKKLLHSHHYEVKSGTLIAPGIPAPVEKVLMENLISTYGKTIHTWHTERELNLPFGPPLIMMGFTADGQIHEELLAKRDNKLYVVTAEKKKQREDIPLPNVDPLANAWEKGIVRQIQIPDSHKHSHSP